MYYEDCRGRPDNSQRVEDTHECDGLTLHCKRPQRCSDTGEAVVRDDSARRGRLDDALQYGENDDAILRWEALPARNE